MRIPMLVTVLVAATALSACASGSRRCSKPQSYAEEQTLATPAAVPGLTIPDSPSALRIPPPPAQAVAFGEKVDDPQNPGKKTYECLDQPPPLRAQTDPATPVTLPSPTAK